MVREPLQFKVHCIEEYRMIHGMTAAETVELFERFGVFEFLEDDILRWQSLGSTVGFIEDFIAART